MCFKPCYNYFKFTVRNHNYVCTNLMSSCKPYGLKKKKKDRKEKEIHAKTTGIRSVLRKQILRMGDIDFGHSQLAGKSLVVGCMLIFPGMLK